MISRKAIILITVLFLIGFAIRLFPINTGFHMWDESVYLQHAEIMSGFRPEANYNEFWIRPPLLPVLFSIGYIFNHSIITLHVIVAFFTALGIVATFLLAKELFNEKIALLSALIFALNPLHVLLSRFLLVDAMLSLFFALTLFFAYKALKALKYSFLAGGFLALAILLKFTSFMLIFLVFLLFFLFQKKSGNIRHAFNIITSKKFLAVIFSCIIVLLPYLVWEQLKFGSPFYTFVNASVVSATPLFTVYDVFFTEIFEFLPFVLVAGIILFSIKAVMKVHKEDIFLVLCVIIPVIIVLLIIHIETRYFMPVLPFLAIMAAKGFLSLPKRQYIFWFVLLFVSLGSVFSLFSASAIHFDTEVSWESAVMDAGIWVNSNLPDDITIYSNYDYPPIAYYSDRKLIVLDNMDDVTQGAYIITSSITDIEPTKDTLLNNENFSLIESFDDGYEVVYIFRHG